MRNRAIALIAIPAMMLMGSLSTVNADKNTVQAPEITKFQDKKNKKQAHHMKKRLGKLSKMLELSDEQETQIKALFEKQSAERQSNRESRKALYDAVRNLDANAADYTEKLAAVKQQAGLQAQEKIDKMLAAKQGIKAILTAEQLKKFEEFKQKREGKRGKRMNKDHS